MNNLEELYHRIDIVYNSIKNTIISSNVNYTSPRSILSSKLDFKKTISQDDYNYIRYKSEFLKDLYAVINGKYDIINYGKKHNIETNENILLYKLNAFESNFSEIISTINDINMYLKCLQEDKEKPIKIEDLTISYSPNNTSINEDINSGTKWLYDLFDMYLKYNTERYVTSKIFFTTLQSSYDKLTDDEKDNLVYITEKILGGVSIDNISIAFSNWLYSNRDIIKYEYSNIIL